MPAVRSQRGAPPLQERERSKAGRKDRSGWGIVATPARDEETSRRSTMANVADVAAYILDRQGPMSGWKLQKLVYYCQAWHLVWEEEPLFPEPMQAWANGPVSPALFEHHRGRFTLDKLEEVKGRAPPDPDNLTKEAREVVEMVLRDYGHQSGPWLSELTHMEAPWRYARQRRECSPGDRCEEEITHNDMAQYYEGLVHQGIRGKKPEIEPPGGGGWEE